MQTLLTLAKNSPKVGEKFRDFTLTDIEQRTVRLGSLVGKSNILLAFYRADWCPYDNGKFSSLSREYERFTSLGTQIVAVSMDDVKKAKKWAEKLKIPFTILCDPSRSAVDLYDVYHKSYGTAYPSFFLIDKKGIIRYAYVGMGYSDRPLNGDVIRAIKKLPS